MSAKGHIWISATLSVLLLGGAVGAASAGPARPSAEVLPLPRDQAPDIPLHPDGGQKLLPAPGESERARQLDGLLKTLKGAVDNTEAKEVELEIWRLWLHSGSDAVDLLMKRVITAINDEDYSLALALLNRIVEIRPGYAEGWNKRASVLFVSQDFQGSLFDIERTLILEPHHFGALSGLGTVLEELGEKKKALEAFRRALELNPFLPGARRAEKNLAAEVEGRDI